MNAKELAAQELTGKALVIANYQRQIDFIERQLKFLNSPLNESGSTSYTFYGDVINDVIEYFENKGIEVLSLENAETRRQNKGDAMYVFIPNVAYCSLTEEDIAEAKNVKYEKLSPYEQMEYIATYEAACRGDEYVTPGDDDYGDDIPEDV